MISRHVRAFRRRGLCFGGVCLPLKSQRCCYRPVKVGWGKEDVPVYRSLR